MGYDEVEGSTAGSVLSCLLAKHLVSSTAERRRGSGMRKGLPVSDANPVAHPGETSDTRRVGCWASKSGNQGIRVLWCIRNPDARDLALCLCVVSVWSLRGAN
jgi:hypothetical protein